MRTAGIVIVTVKAIIHIRTRIRTLPDSKHDALPNGHSHSHHHVHFNDSPPSHSRSPTPPRTSGQRTVSHSHTYSQIPSIHVNGEHGHHATHNHHNHHQRAVSLQIPTPTTPFQQKDPLDLLTPQTADQFANSPLTPGYKFGQDDHFDLHHNSAHVPNLHNHSHGHDHHEGHSHNMRGVFLHVMAVSCAISPYFDEAKLSFRIHWGQSE